MTTKKIAERLFYIGGGFLIGGSLSSIYYHNDEDLKKDSSNSTLTSFSSPNNIKTNLSEPKHDDTKYEKILDKATFNLRIKKAIEGADELCEKLKTVQGIPGLVVCVSVNGKNIWSKGYGFSDIENGLKMHSKSVLRIASISKSLTMGMLGKLIEDGKIDICKPIQTYLPEFPIKTINGKEMTITTQDLLSHLSGIRHYHEEKKDENKDDKNETKQNEFLLKEYFYKDKYKSVTDSLELFKNDPLLHEPGSKYLYSTHGFTVVSAIIEKIIEKPFEKHAKSMFAHWGLRNTYLDEPEAIIYHRAKTYTRDEKTGVIFNSPYVDLSYKWAGGGFLSTVVDLNKFANVLLASYQNPCDKNAFLKRETLERIWSGDERTYNKKRENFLYALGFVVREPFRKCYFCAQKDFKTVFHTGGAIGATSVLLLSFPKNYRNNTENEKGRVKGVVVSMICNLTDAPLSSVAHQISDLFSKTV